MDPEPTAPEQEQIEIPELGLLERRVLGVLIEKAKTTPDAYPLSINALTNGCNQKSNRDPVLSLDEDDVEDALEALQKRGLVIHITGSGRVERWRHNVYDEWLVGKVDLAIIAELLLRGEQSIGELRGRANRMEPISDLDTLREHLDKLAERGMIVWLTASHQRGARVTHGFQPKSDLDRIRQHQPPEPSRTSTAPSTAVPPAAPSIPPTVVYDSRTNRLEQDLAQAQTEIRELRTVVEEMQSTIANLTTDVERLREDLGG